MSRNGANEEPGAGSRPARVLTVNSGSSSIKFSLHRMGPVEALVVSGAVERIGVSSSSFFVRDSEGKTRVDRNQDLPDHEAGVGLLFDWLRDNAPEHSLDVVGHRIVHGGASHVGPQLLNRGLISELRELIPLAPDHLPHELAAIKAVSRAYSDLPQVACFDTAFHRRMPRVAQTYALPGYLREKGVVRYGFHGLSYEYILQDLGREAGSDVAAGRLVLAHLGGGASMVAVREGRSLDTTMGLTPAGGLVMSTRAGDMDPGVLLYLLQEERLAPRTLNDLVNRQAGLLALSGRSGDMKVLLDHESNDPGAAEAVAVFCYQAKKHLGALAAVLGGIDTLVFTGGIGENAPSIRRRICEGLDFLGIRLSPERNSSGDPIISADDSVTTVRVMKTDEELMIARHAYAVCTDYRRKSPSSNQTPVRCARKKNE